MACDCIVVYRNAPSDNWKAYESLRQIYSEDVVSDQKKVALVTSQGTACSETVLYADEDTPEMRASIERQFCSRAGYDQPLPGTWTDVSDNDAL